MRLHRAIQSLLLFFLKQSCGAFCQIAQGQSSDGNTHESKHFYSQCFEHSANVTVLAFVENNFQPRIVFTLTKDAGNFDAQDFTIGCSNSISQLLQ